MCSIQIYAAVNKIMSRLKTLQINQNNEISVHSVSSLLYAALYWFFICMGYVSLQGKLSDILMLSLVS